MVDNLCNYCVKYENGSCYGKVSRVGKGGYVDCGRFIKSNPDMEGGRE